MTDKAGFLDHLNATLAGLAAEGLLVSMARVICRAGRGVIG